MWINRILSNELIKLATQFPAVILTGPRQTGKTALLEKTFSDYNYVTLDFAQNAESAESNPMEFLNNNPAPLIIDEIQYAPSLLRHLKVKIDQNRTRNGQFFITGSQSFSLMKQVSESLSGRAAVIEFHGLSYQEILGCYRYKFPKNNISFLFRGSFPELWAHPENPLPINRWYQSYITTYLERDIRNLANIGNLRDFERFLRVAASRIGQRLNMSDIGRDIGISPTTAKSWFSILQASGQIVLLEPYYRSLGKRISKTPKLYFQDTGLAAFLCGYNTPESIQNAINMGSFWENHVIGQWLRWNNWLQPSASLWYWQDQSKNEIDLIIDYQGRLIPIEIKWKEKPSVKDIKGITAFQKMYGSSVNSFSYIACNTNGTFNITDQVIAKNGWDIWEIP